jgi:murein DD-endopeptidase MepM/ murein hydrolase activator NlpD
MCYWTTFRRTVAEVIEESYRVWGDFGKPIIPILQGDATVLEQQEALQLLDAQYNARAVSWWRYGRIGRWDAVNSPVVIDDTPAEEPTGEEPDSQYGIEVTIFAGGPGHRSGTYTGKQEFIPFTNVFGWQAYYTSTEPTTSKVWAEWRVDLPESGNYQISVFIPGRHATTKKARYKIHGIRGTNTEVIVDLNQSIYRNVWVPLGVFDLVKGQENAGKVFLNDVTGESGLAIAFDAIRLRRVIRLPGPTRPGPGTIPDVIDGVPIADGYESPVGSAAERVSRDLWPPGWRDASPFGQLYFVGTAREAYHTGADLNWGSPYADKGLPVYATANGTVIFAGRLKTWGNVIVIRHDPLKSPTGKVMYSRYGHIQEINVKAGDRVKRGQQVAEIGDAFGTLIPHLHFDLSPTTVLESRPSDWPGRDGTRLFRDYVDPLLFIKNSLP